MTDQDQEKRGKPEGARPNRHGDPWQRGDGRWCVRVYPPQDGAKPVLVYGKTSTECRRKAKDKADELAEGKPGGRGKTVAEYFEHWTTTTLPQQVRTNEIDASTAKQYSDNVRLHILPGLGWMKLADLGVAEVRKWQDDLLTKEVIRRRTKLRKGEKRLPRPGKLSERSVGYCHAILRRALNDAIREQVWGVKENPVLLVKPPKQVRREKEPITPDEARALLATMADDRWWCYWLVVFTLGLRRGEGLGLRWADVDFDARTIKLAGQVQRVEGQLVVKDLKTDGSHRKMAAPQVALDALAEWQREQRRIRMKSNAWLDADLVFTTNVGTAIEPRNVNRQWETLCRKAVTRTIHVHDLRHACATYLVAAGVDIRTVQGQLRHARMATTEIYVHMLDDVQREAADTMDAIITDLRKPKKARETS